MDTVIGTAGWSIARDCADLFPAEGTALQRYSHVFRGVEINSSFHRSHRASTWEKWAASVPDDFRFSVKAPKTITHQAKLVDAHDLTASFAEEVKPLGGKLAIVLVQLPPKLGFDAPTAERFFTHIRNLVPAEIACEPRNESWFSEEANGLLERLRVARVAADPARFPAAALPGGWPGLPYWRLHGSPTIYRSSYTGEALDHYAQEIAGHTEEGATAWCVFDNTAGSGATGNALSLSAKLKR